MLIKIIQGTIGQTFYIILQGSVGVWIRVPNKRNEPVLTEVKVIEAGSSFGELALLSNKPRAATIIAKEDTHLAVLEKKDFQRILSIYKFHWLVISAIY